MFLAKSFQFTDDEENQSGFVIIIKFWQLQKEAGAQLSFYNIIQHFELLTWLALNLIPFLSGGVEIRNAQKRLTNGGCSSSLIFWVKGVANVLTDA